MGHRCYIDITTLSPDGNTLYVCRDMHPENTDGSRQDIWISNRHDDGTWGKLENIGKPLNNNSNNSVISVVSADDNILLVKNTYNIDGSHKDDGISITRKTNKGWTTPEPVDIEDFYNNSEYLSLSLSADRNFLVLAIKREDTYGGEDLYVSFKNGLKYTRPMNLGPEINSNSWDAYYNLPASGEYAFLVSSRNSFGNTDVFMIKLPEDAKPNPVALIYGKVLNAKTNEPIEAEIIYSIMSSDSIIGKADSEADKGFYKIILPYNNEYSFLASKTGFYSVSDNINISHIDEYTEVERNLYLSPIEKGDIIRLNNVFFDFDSSILKEDSFHELNRLVTVLLENPAMKIEIGGHTDSDGSESYNQRLSQNRVNSIIDYLTGNSIEQFRLTAIGYGELIPIAPNETEEGKALNRRVEFTILEM
jgi:outer membrane protein OmpA-like peptidoglycan-associated protein